MLASYFLIRPLTTKKLLACLGIASNTTITPVRCIAKTEDITMHARHLRTCSQAGILLLDELWIAAMLLVVLKKILHNGLLYYLDRGKLQKSLHDTF